MNKEQIKRLTCVVLGMTLIAVLGIALIVGQHFGIHTVCPMKEFMNIDCPGCGGTRMVISILKGNMNQAFRYNPFLFITLPIMFVIGIAQSKKFILSGELSYWLDKVLITYAILLLAFGILRNTSILSCLKPTII